MFVLDTNILIYFFKGMGNVSHNLFKVAKHNIALPSIVAYEIETGIAKSLSPNKRREQFDIFLNHVRIIPFSIDEARASAMIRADLEKAGESIGPYDILIAGAAYANNATLVTHNTKEFSRVKNLKLADWF